MKIAALIGAILLLHAADSVRADEAPPQFEVQAGIQRYVKVGRWAPVTVRTLDKWIKSVEVEALDPGGKTARFPLTADKSGKVFRGLFMVGRLESVVSLRIESGGGTVITRRLGGGVNDDADAHVAPVLRQSVIVVATLGKPAGFKTLFADPEEDGPTKSTAKKRKQAARFHTVDYANPADFPNSVHGLNGVDAVVISDRYELNAIQTAALRQWVRGGGHLVVSRGSLLTDLIDQSTRRTMPALLGTTAAIANDANFVRKTRSDSADTLLAEWLPVTIRRQLSLRAQDLAELKTFSQQKVPIISSGRIPVAQVRDPSFDGAGEVLAGGGDRPNLIVRVPFGLGLVTFCAVDLHRPPVSTWEEVDAMGRRILEPTIEAVTPQDDDGNARISGSGLTDVVTQLHAMQDEFPTVRRASTWDAMLWVFLYILLIGPLDYVLVHRVLKRPRWTWVTFPLMVVLVTWWAIHSAEARNGSAVRVNQLTIVDIDATDTRSHPYDRDRARVITRSWFSFYSPETQRYTLEVAPSKLSDIPSETSQPSLGWSGFPEDVYGGMYRPGGLEIGRLSYAVLPEQRRIDGLPLRIWAAQTLHATDRRITPGLVRGALKLSDTNRLVGTIEHRLAGPISDWVVVYGNHLYRPGSKNASQSVRSIPPGQTWSLNQEGIIQLVREEELKPNSAADENERLNFFIRTLSVHGSLRRADKFGLQNVSLADLDFTRLLKLKRAVLIGRIKQPGMRLSNASGEGESEVIEPTRSNTFVRIVLPVQQRSSR